MNFLPLLIAKRLYVQKNKNSTVSFISLLSKIGISISVFTLIMSFSALNNFEKLINQTTISILPHGIIKFTNKSFLTWEEIIKKLTLLPDISYAEPYIITNGLIIKNNKIKPIEIKSFKSINFLKKKFFFEHANNNLKKKIIFLIL